MVGISYRWVKRLIAGALLGSPMLLTARQLTGAVVSDHSGVSGRGVGFLELTTKAERVRIDYAKPIHVKLGREVCGDLGAIWTVETRMIDGTETLVRGKCDGKVDVAVHSAWLATQRFLHDAVTSTGEKPGFDPNRSGPIYARLGGLQVDIYHYFGLAPRLCLDFQERVDARTILMASGECLDEELEFTVQDQGAAGWRVTDVKKAVRPPGR